MSKDNKELNQLHLLRETVTLPSWIPRFLLGCLWTRDATDRKQLMKAALNYFVQAVNCNEKNEKI